LYFAEVAVQEPPEWIYDELPLDDAIFERLDHFVPPPILSADTYHAPEDIYIDAPTLELAEDISIREVSLLDTVERDTDWLLQESGIIIEAIQPDREADPTGYAVGVVEIWQDPHTGDQTGAYLHMADAPHLERAEEMRSNIYRLADERNIPDAEFGDFAHGLIKGRGEWQPLSDAQWERIDTPLAPDTPNFTNDTLWEARGRMLEQAFETLADDFQREDIDETVELEQVIQGLGIQIEDFDPTTTPPPLFDEETNTAYWVGVYHDPETPDQGITSLLSITVGENGEPEARLAPVATGDLDHAQRTAEYLLNVADRTQDVGQLLDAAEGMAVATQHRELWETAQGIPVADDITFSPVSMEIE
jgi:hypothetical protein